MNKHPTAKSNAGAALLPIGLAIALLAMLFPSSARIVGIQPWRVELLTTAILFWCIAAEYLRDKRSVVRMFRIDDRRVRWLVLSLAGLAIWSLASALWAHSPLAAWHHAIVWTNYILFFLFARQLLLATRSYRFIVTAFLALTGILSVLCLIDYVTLPDFRSLESTLRMRYSKYAEVLITALPFIWVLATYIKKRGSYVLVTLAGVAGWVTVMMSLSKGAFLAGIFGFALTFAGSLLFGSKRLRPRLGASLGIWLAITLITQAGFSLFSTIPSTTEYISGSRGSIRESSIARMFVWNVGTQMAADNWLTGVGANNFGAMFNGSRAAYRLRHPTVPNDEVLSDQVAERAHNEPLQVLAELGIVGLMLLAVPAILFVGILFLAWRQSYRGTPIFWATLGGLSAFAASSMISSFSFRLAQNGIVFFLVFAVAIYELGKFVKPFKLKPARGFPAPAVFAAASLILTSALITFAVRAAAEHYASLADSERQPETAIDLYKYASRLDPENGMFYLRSSSRSRKQKDHATAAVQQRRAIENGLGIVVTYSILAEDYSKSGDSTAAEATLIESLAIFPRSVFLRVRYAFMLQDAGRVLEAENQLAAAKSIDGAQYAGWYNLLRNGSVSAYYAALADPDVAAPADLRPEAAVLLYLDESPDSGL